MHRRQTATGLDKGFTLIELLVVVVIIGILATIAIPLFLNQKAKAYNASVQADLHTLATAAETALAKDDLYPATAAEWTDAGLVTSKGNNFTIFVQTQGSKPGYIAYGVNSNTRQVFMLSSFKSSVPVKISTSPGADWHADISIALAASDNGVGSGYFTDLVPWMDTPPVDVSG